MSIDTSKQRDLFPGALELMILRVVQRRPLHGYALVAEIKQSSGDLLRVEEGSLYMALQRMLKERWLSAKWSVSLTNRRVRVYSITPAGRKRLTTEVSKFAQMLEGVHRVLRYEH